MRSRFDEQLALLNRELIEMGALCEEVIAVAAQALMEGDTALAAEQRPCEGVVCARVRREDRCRICPLDPPRWAHRPKAGEDGEDRGKVPGELYIDPEPAGAGWVLEGTLNWLSRRWRGGRALLHWG